MLVREGVVVLAVGVLEAIWGKEAVSAAALWLGWHSGRLTVAVVVGGVGGVIELEVSVEGSALVYFEGLQVVMLALRS